MNGGCSERTARSVRLPDLPRGVYFVSAFADRPSPSIRYRQRRHESCTFAPRQSIGSYALPITEPPASSVAARERETVHFSFLDGIRGLSAIYVMLSHLMQALILYNPHVPRPDWLIHATTWMIYGHLAVVFFIVLSGFCLMLPVARSRDKELRGGVSGYIQRRARRILPAYYAAIVFTVLLSIRHFRNVGLSNVAAHFLVVHNLSRSWVWSIDPPTWSVGMEWQIYFVFALLLLPVWRRWGSTAALTTGVLLGLAPLCLPARFDLVWTSPWLIGLFAFGMIGAVYAQRDFDAVFWRRTALVLTAVVICTACALPHDVSGDSIAVNPKLAWVLEFLVGIVALSVILGCCKSCRLQAILSHPALVKIGVFSYSLYLIHFPLLAFFYARISGFPFYAKYALMFCLIPVIMAIAYVFHLAFERPFMVQARAPQPQGGQR